jgi:dipeptide transport system permease protein
LIRSALVFLLASLALFMAIEWMPEDPVSLRIKNPDPERVEAIREELGLNDALVVRYGRVLTDFVVLDWGTSLISGRSVRAEVARFLPATIELGLGGLLLGSLLGSALVLSAHASGRRWLLHPVRGLAALGLTVPIFWIGLLMILFFAVALDWLPAGGRFDYLREAPSGTGFFVLDSLLAGDLESLRIALSHLFLPAMTLALYPAAVVAGTLESRLGEPAVGRLVAALEARGISVLKIWGWHIPRLLSGPVATVIGTQAGALLGGAVLTETVYSWPGMGRFLVDGVLNRDIFVIQNGLLLVVLLALTVTAIADILARILDPRLRISQRRAGHD